MRDSRNCQALFFFMSDERNVSWWNEQQAFRYLIKHQTQRKQTMSQSFEREHRENRENTKQSKNINNTHQTMLKVGNAKRGKSRKNTEWRVLIMAIPESLSEDPSTCFLLSSLAWRKAPLCRYLLLFSSVFSVLLSKPAILQTCPICSPKASPISPQPPESSPLERPSEKQQKNPAPRAGVYSIFSYTILRKIIK